MGPDCYKVDIVHYNNPYLIWVEVLQANSKEEFVFEQIGIYGVLPIDTTIDFDEGLKSQRSKEWTPAASVLMKKIFFEAKDVWFSPTYIDRRSSIFDDNIHKYGELIIHTASGKKRLLSKSLLKSGLAIYDECLFHQELSLGNLKTKLSQVKIEEVVNELKKGKCESKKTREKLIKKQTAVFHETQNLESVLTARNLEKHNSSIKIESVLENKVKDLLMCKDVDEESLGRGCKSKTSQPKMSMYLRKKLEIAKQKKNEIPRDEKQNNECKDIFEMTKKFLESVAVKDDSFSDKTKSPESVNRSANMYSPSETDSMSNTLPNNTRELNYKRELSNVRESSKRETSNASEWSNKSSESPNVPKQTLVLAAAKLRGIKKAKNKIPEYDIETEKRVAYGPPDCNFMKLPMKIVPKEEIPDPVANQTEPVLMTSNNEETLKKDYVYAEMDSELGVEITNKDILKKQYNTMKGINESAKEEIQIYEAIVKQEELVNEEKIKSDEEKMRKNEQHIKEIEEKMRQMNGKMLERKERMKKVEQKTEDSYIDSSEPSSTTASKALQKRLMNYKKNMSKELNSSFTSGSDTTNKDSSSSAEIKPKRKEDKKKRHSDSDESISDVIEKLSLDNSIEVSPKKIDPPKVDNVQVKNNVNPFKNIDTSISVFVDKLVTPVLMVHTKMNSRIQPCFNLRDAPFNSHIHAVLRNMSIEHPMMLQTISWTTILRGHSIFMVSPLGSGKSMGYLPAICRLVTDAGTFADSVGPACIIVCATAQSVSEVEKLAKMFLGFDEKVFSCYAGIDELSLTTSLLNGCDLFICTPSALVRLLQMTDFGIDLRRLSTFVLDDCERLSEVYGNEIKFFLFKIKEMLKARTNKELKVQYVLSSRVWCDFMEPLAKKAPNTVVCIGAFQESVIYAKAETQVSFVLKENKVNTVIEFMKSIDSSKKTVIVCRSDDEVDLLQKALSAVKFAVFASDSKMTVQDLYNLSLTLKDYEEPLLGPTLICCDSNLTHLNVSDANYLVHYSLPQLFSMFCKRFSVLNDNYASIFKPEKQDVKIKILLEDNNVEQLPKILHFIKRCTSKLPETLDVISEAVLAEKNLSKAKNLVPVCDSLLANGECVDVWNCQQRHTVFKEYDEPNDWMPKDGIITFDLLHYHTAVLYSARLLSNTTKAGTKQYSQTYTPLTMKMGRYFSKEANRKLHGIPKPGDYCAVAKKLNFFVRCQVIKVISKYPNGNPNYVLIKLIDEEIFERTRDVYLYHLPEELKAVETHTIQVRLANIQPKDRDVTFSELAKRQLKNITDKDETLYMKGRVAMTIGNCVFVDTLEACQDLTSLNETVAKHDFKKLLLEKHALPKPDHIKLLEKMCEDSDLKIKSTVEVVEAPAPKKEAPKAQWAHLEADMSSVYFAAAVSPGKFFVRLIKFEDCMQILLKDIQSYVSEKREPIVHFEQGDIVLAKFPDDSTYERARIDRIINEDKVDCFFVDQGDWREVPNKHLIEIPNKFITQIPFQAIECRLVGIKPAGEEWTDFSTNWLYDFCFDKSGDLKHLYVKYYTKERSESTEGHRYGVTLIDTTTEQDVIVNQLMIDVNLAQVVEEEFDYLYEVTSNLQENKIETVNDSVSEESSEEDWEKVPNDIVPRNESASQREALDKIFLRQPSHSVPLAGSDSESDDSKWSVNMNEDFLTMFKGFTKNPLPEVEDSNKKLQIEAPGNSKEITPVVQKIENEKMILAPQKTEKQIENIASPDPKIGKVDKTPKVNETAKIETQIDKEPEKSNVIIKNSDQSRKPKVCWRQNKQFVIIKILLIGVEKYDIEIKEKHIKFSADANETFYSFDFEFYGVINTEQSIHSNKGQYIFIKCAKVLQKNWLSLTRDASIKKWIVYDVDSLDASSDEEDSVTQLPANIPVPDDSDSENDSMVDDVNFTYDRGF